MKVNNEPLHYRPEIDGLRAVAVIAVVLYHAEFVFGELSLFSGGFVGVDVFFVISGYLITSIILREMKKGEFSFGHFYERRARRILPALFTVMLASIPFAWMYLLPKAMKEYAASVLSALAFGSNIWFWQEDSYTAAASALKPFLHTWSLSVEEQFYIFFPLLVFLLWKYLRNHLTSIFIAMFSLSLMAAQYGSVEFVDANFYLLPTRGWELLIGAILATIELSKGRQNYRILSAVIPAAGLLMIICAVLLFDDGIRHPSLMTLLPVLGTALIIWFCGYGEPVFSILANKVVVGTGLISYSFYLWHYPIFAFARINNSLSTSYEKLFLILLSLILSIAVYFSIEKPMRSKGNIQLKYFAMLVGLVFTTIAVLNFHFIKTDGAKYRMEGAKDALLIGKYSDPVGEKNCFRPIPRLGLHCIFPLFSSEKKLFLVGDSHAAVLSHSVYDLAKGSNRHFEYLPDCVFIEGTERMTTRHKSMGRVSCVDEQLQYLSEIEPSVIIASQRLAMRMTGLAADGISPPETGRKFYEYFVPLDRSLSIGDSVAMTIQKLLAMGHVVVQVFPIPEQLMHVPNEYGRILREANPLEFSKIMDEQNFGVEYEAYNQRNEIAFNALESVAHENYIKVYPHKLFCLNDKGLCLTNIAGNILYSDQDHLSRFGAQQVVNVIEGELLQRDEQ